MTALSLHGKTVLVPRGKRNAKAFSEIVKEFDGIPIEVPLIGFRSVENKEGLLPIINNVHTYDWLIFTSKVTVDTFFSIVDKKLELPRIAVIGEKTADAIRDRGMSVDFQPMEYVSESFVKEFFPFVEKGQKMLLPKGNLARDYIASFFREKGLIVDEIVIYETIFPVESKEKLVQLLKQRKLQILPFTSPSTVANFMSVVEEYGLHEEIQDCIVACIGPVAKKKCEEYGLRVQVVPETYTSYDMIMGVAAYLSIQVETHE